MSVIWPPTALALAEAVMVLVRTHYVRNGFWRPSAVFLATRNPDTGRPIEPTLLSYGVDGAPSSFVSQLRAMALELDALMVVQAYEIRMVGALNEQARSGFEPVGDAPRARDYLVIFLEDRRFAAPRAWLAPVDTARHGVLEAPFASVPIERVDGWLTAILDPRN